MKKEEKEPIVSKLRDRFSRANVIVLVNYKGVTVEEIQDIKRQLRAVKGEVTVVKNTLAILAITGSPLEKLHPYFRGPVFVVFSYGGDYSSVKALSSIAEKQKKLTIKGGIIDSELMDVAAIQRISLLPSKQVLLGQFIGGLKAPLYGLAGSLSGIVRKFALTLKALHQKREAS